MMKVSFIGLGVMGMGMALNLAKREKYGEFEYLACDMDPEALVQFKEKGIKTTTNLKDTIDSDYIFLCLPNLEIVKEVVLGNDGLLNHLTPGQSIIDFSTISYMGAVEIANTCDSKGINFLDCPISGQHKKSMDGTLSIMCGGNEEVFNTIKPMLDKMGTQVLYMGQ